MQQSQTSFHAVSDDIEGIPNPYTQRIIKALEANFVEHIVVLVVEQKVIFTKVQILIFACLGTLV